MKSIKEIESAIKNLSPEEFARFQEWYDSFEADHWDRQLEEDINAGRLEKLSRQAVDDFRKGRCTEL